MLQDVFLHALCFENSSVTGTQHAVRVIQQIQTQFTGKQVNTHAGDVLQKRLCEGFSAADDSGGIRNHLIRMIFLYHHRSGQICVLFANKRNVKRVDVLAVSRYSPSATLQIQGHLRAFS